MKVALVQMCSGRDPAANLEKAGELIAQAAANGADFVATPEVTNIMEEDKTRLHAAVETFEDDQSLAFFAGLAREHGVHLLVGSVGLKSGDGRLVNRSLFYGPDGKLQCFYDKVHMFDVDLGGSERYRESANYQAGKRLVLADTPFAKIGLSICYDVRFAYLYRQLAKAGAKILTVPAAFTKVSGEAHWHVLLRARAIETGCFVIAPAQSGQHENGRETYGHSLVVSPWGEVICDGGNGVGVSYATLDLEDVDAARAKIPALNHDREVTL